jgi:predicted amidophosphoribosyltransferase
MCFRPSAVAGDSGNQVQTGACPSCGQPIAASIGIITGTCPHCGKPIPPDSKGDPGTADLGTNAKIF